MAILIVLLSPTFSCIDVTCCFQGPWHESCFCFSPWSSNLDDAQFLEIIEVTLSHTFRYIPHVGRLAETCQVKKQLQRQLGQWSGDVNWACGILWMHGYPPTCIEIYRTLWKSIEIEDICENLPMWLWSIPSRWIQRRGRRTSASKTQGRVALGFDLKETP